MTCKYCGTTATGNARFCTNCGADMGDLLETPAQPSYPQPTYPQPDNSQPDYNQPDYNQPMYNNVSYSQNSQAGQKAATTALVWSILSLFCCGLIGAILGLVYSNRAIQEGYTGSEAKIAKIISIVSLVLTVLGMIISIASAGLYGLYGVSG